MTKKQRAQVAQLLRCAADGRRNGISLALAGDRLGHCDGARVYLLACEAYMQVNGIPSEWYWVNWRRRRGLLEAAQRVEDGSWP